MPTNSLTTGYALMLVVSLWIGAADALQPPQPAIDVQEPQDPSSAGAQRSDCPSDKPFMVPGKFGAPMAEVQARLQKSDFASALALVDRTENLAITSREKLFLEQLRTKALTGLGDKSKLLASLEAQQATNCLSGQAAMDNKGQIEKLRGELKLLPK